MSATTGSGTQDNNVAIGYKSMEGVLDGARANVAVGYQSMKNSSFSGDDNVAVGEEAGSSLTSGSKNLLLGVGSGNITTGSSNTIIGYGGGSSATGDHQLEITSGGSVGTVTWLTGESDGGVTVSEAYKLPTAVTGANDYVLTAQTDGSTAWAAAGGGGSSYNQARNPNADLYTGYTTYLISRGVGFTTVGAMTTTVETRTNYRQISFRPFIAPQSGDLTAFLAYVSTAGAATDISLGIYDDDGGAPNDLMGTATIDCSSTGAKTQTSISATITLVEGTQYWYSWVTTNSTDSPGLRAEDQDYTQFASNQTNSIAGTDSQQYIIDVLATANTSPASITRTNLYPAGGNSGGNPRIGVQF